MGPLRADTFIGYFTARFREEQERMAYMTYMTDSMYLRDRGKSHSKRWIDIVRPRAAEDVDPQAVLDDLAERAGLVIV